IARERGPMVEPSKSGGGAALRRAAAGVALPVGVVYVIEGQEPAPLLFSTGAGEISDLSTARSSSSSWTFSPSHGVAHLRGLYTP
ncbi:Os01g0167100, partial [Oryza sativa Japonica Group]